MYLCIQRGMSATFYDTAETPQPCHLGIYDNKSELVKLQPLGFSIQGRHIIATEQIKVASGIDAIKFCGQSYSINEQPDSILYLVHTEHPENYEIQRYLIGIDRKDHILYAVPQEDVPPTSIQRVPGAQAATDFINHRMKQLIQDNEIEAAAAADPINRLIFMQSLLRDLSVEVFFQHGLQSFTDSRRDLAQFPDGSVIELNRNGCRPLNAKELQILYFGMKGDSTETKQEQPFLSH